ncbi:MAG: hypothetical protein K1000chlam1_01621 [Candidatus Anoxychlamydiales bacterium]|nr:hypothetical protein [Candidatus Anoxychlamydiales bacterium]
MLESLRSFLSSKPANPYSTSIHVAAHRSSGEIETTDAKTSEAGRKIAESEAEWESLSSSEIPDREKPNSISWQAFYQYEKDGIKSTEHKVYDAYNIAQNFTYNNMIEIASIIPTIAILSILFPYYKLEKSADCYFCAHIPQLSAPKIAWLKVVGLLVTYGIFVALVLDKKSVRSKLSHLGGKANQFRVISYAQIKKKLGY